MQNNDQDFQNFDIDPEEFKKLGYDVIDLIAEYYASIRYRRITSQNSSSEIEKIFADDLPIKGESPAAIIRDWNVRILPNAAHLGSPRYFGFVNGSGNMISVLADALATSVNMNAGGWKAGPAATEIERRSIAWIAELINYPADCGGLFVGGGMVANYTALLTALRNTAGYNSTDEGLQSENRKGRYTIYMSDHEGHISIVKAADILNLGRNSIRRVQSNEDLTMNITSLEKMLDEDTKAGLIPFCVVAQVGSINVGVIDPLEEISRICRERNLWFHADGACGALGAMLPELSHFYNGLEKADSVTLDPHKWLYIPYECGCVLIRNVEKLRRTFSIAAPYLQNSLPTDYKGLDYFEYGPNMSRGFNALKVWMSLRYHGKEGYQQLLRQNILCAKHLHKLVQNSSDFIPMHHPELFIYSFRFVPEALKPTATAPDQKKYLDELNQKIADEIMASGFAFIMTSKIKNQIVLRLSICSHRTTLHDIELVFNRLREIGNQLFKNTDSIIKNSEEIKS